MTTQVVRTTEERERLIDRLAREVWGTSVSPQLRTFAAAWLSCEETDGSDDEHVARWRAEMCCRATGLQDV